MFRKAISQIASPFLYKRCQIDARAYVSLKARATDSTVETGARLAEHCDIRQCRVGRFTSVGRYTKMVRVDVGKFSAISWDVTVNVVVHPHTHATISAFPYVKRMGGFVEADRQRDLPLVEIANDVWVGANSVIMPGVKIGTGAVIGAGSVVTKDVPPYAIAAGVPARIIKKRFDEEIIQELLLSHWWDASDALIKKNVGLFQEPLTIHLARTIRNTFE